MEETRNRLIAGKSKEDAEQALQVWDDFSEFYEEAMKYNKSPELEAFMAADSGFDFVGRNIARKDVEKSDLSIEQMKALSLICPNFNEVMDEVFGESEGLKKPRKK